MRETGVILAVGAVLAGVIGVVLFVRKLDEGNVDMLTTGFTVAMVLVPVAVIVVALAWMMGRSRPVEVGGWAMPELPAIRVDRPEDLRQRRDVADTTIKEAKAAREVMLLEDSQRNRKPAPELQPGRWVATELER